MHTAQGPHTCPSGKRDFLPRLRGGVNPVSTGPRSGSDIAGPLLPLMFTTAITATMQHPQIAILSVFLQSKAWASKFRPAAQLHNNTYQKWVPNYIMIVHLVLHTETEQRKAWKRQRLVRILLARVGRLLGWITKCILSTPTS